MNRLHSRRHFLQAGAISYLGLSLPQLLRAEAMTGPARPAPTADACILIFLNGGPSHLDMWDPKPDAPAEIRGEFQPIATSVPGVHFGELMPRMARLMHQMALIRSAHHSVNNSHAAAVYAALTGHDRGEAGGGAKPTDNPAIGSVVGSTSVLTAMPPYVALPYITKEGAGGPPQPGFFGGWLGHSHDPLWVLRDPNAADFRIEELSPPTEVSTARIRSRQELLRGVGFETLSRSGQAVREMNDLQEKAFDLLTSSATQQAFRVDLEPAAVREAYGRNIYGQSLLLARRLIEAGTRVACLSWAPDANATWDTHNNNFKRLKGALLPQLDAAVSSLLDDLIARGRLERTLVVVMGEFGRTPKVNQNAGRDHWNYCYGLLLAGGGIKRGHVFGASDKIGGYPVNNPVTPADIVATIYHCLGIPPDLQLRDKLARPLAVVPGGQVINDLLTTG